MEPNKSDDVDDAGHSSGIVPSPSEVGTELHQSPGLDNVPRTKVNQSSNALAESNSVTDVFENAMAYLPASTAVRLFIPVMKLAIRQVEIQLQGEKETTSMLRKELAGCANANREMLIELAEKRTLIGTLRASRKIQGLLGVLGTVLFGLGFKLEFGVVSVGVTFAGAMLVLAVAVWPTGDSK